MNTKKNTQKANKHKTRCSALLIIREMQITATMRYYYTPVRIVKIKKTDIPDIGED